MKVKYAPVAELADAPDLGSGVPDVKVQVLSGAPSSEQSSLCSDLFYFGGTVFDKNALSKFFTGVDTERLIWYY